MNWVRVARPYVLWLIGASFFCWLVWSYPYFTERTGAAKQRSMERLQGVANDLLTVFRSEVAEPAGSNGGSNFSPDDLARACNDLTNSADRLSIGVDVLTADGTELASTGAHKLTNASLRPEFKQRSPRDAVRVRQATLSADSR